MKSILINLIALLFFLFSFSIPNTAFSQVYIGMDSVNNTYLPFNLPFNPSGGFTRSVSLYTSAEMNTVSSGGTITSISWQVDSTNATAPDAPLFIYFKQVGNQGTPSFINNGVSYGTSNYATNFASLVSNATLVYSGVPHFIKGWNNIDINDYAIGANQNLEIYVEYNYILGSSSNNSKFPRFLSSITSHASTSATYLSQTVGLGGSPAKSLNCKPNIILNGLPAHDNVNMHHVSHDVISSSFSYAYAGRQTLNLLKIAIRTNGARNPITATKFNFSTNMVAGDISNAKLYYTGRNSDFKDSVLVGNTANPSGNFSITSNQMLTGRSLTNDTNYFWLTYDVSCASGNGHQILTKCDSFILEGENYIVPGSSINAVNVSNSSGSGNATVRYYSTGNATVKPGSPNLYVGYVQIWGNCNVADVSELKFNTGSIPPGTIQNVRCYYVNKYSDTSTSFPFGNAVANPNGDFTFTGYQPLNFNTETNVYDNYFKLVCDVSCNVVNNTAINIIPVTAIFSGTQKSISNNQGSQTKAVVPVSPNPQYASTTTTTAGTGDIVSMGYIRLTGDSCGNNTTKVVFYDTSTNASNIAAAKCYYTNSPVFNINMPFGSAVSNPNDTITFSGNKVLAPGTENYFWLAYDMNCTATLGDSILAIPISITTNNNSVYQLATPASNIAKKIQQTYVTVADGDWSDPSVWDCNGVPISGANVTIRNNITITTAINTIANLTISPSDTLIFNGGSLTMGQQGGDNKIFADYGTLIMNSGTFNINGQFRVNRGGRYIQSGGNINVDGNATGGSGTSLAGAVVGWTFESAEYANLTGGTLTIIDPVVGGYYVTFAASNLGSTAINCSPDFTLRFGNGISMTSNPNFGFGLSTSKINFGKIVVEESTSYVNDRFVEFINGVATNELIIKTNGSVKNSSNTTLYGDLTLENGNHYTGTGTITFNGSATQYITGISPALSVNVRNYAGVVYNLPNVNDTLTLGDLGLYYGKFEIGNTHTLVLQKPITDSLKIKGTIDCKEIICSVPANTSQLYFPSGNNNLNQVKLKLASNTAGKLRARWYDSDPGTYGLPLQDTNVLYTYSGLNYQSISNAGYWTIEPSNGFSTSSYDATFYYKGINVPENLIYTFAKRSNASNPWTLKGNPATNYRAGDSTYVILRRNITQFSDFAIVFSSSQTILPLNNSLLSFNGKNQGSINKLNWKIIQDENLDHFTVQRSADATDFKNIGMVNMIKVFKDPVSYSFDDASPFLGKNFYRLIMENKAGEPEYSNVIELSPDNANGFRIETFPNPVSGDLHVKTYGTQEGNGRLQIFDLTGRLLVTIPVSSHETIINMNALQNGIYIIRYTDDVNYSTLRISKL